MMTAFKEYWRLLREAIKRFGEDEAGRFGASLAYYAVFSLAPLLVIAIGIAGIVFGVTAAEERILRELESFLGADGIETVRGLVHATDNKEAGGVLALVGLVALIFGASGVFRELKEAFNRVFDVPQQRSSFLGFVMTNLFSFGMVLSTGFLLLISLLLSTAVNVASEYFTQSFIFWPALWETLNFLISFFMTVGLFILLYRYIPDRRLPWRVLFFGALVTALLFTLGKTLIGIYLGQAGVASSYGAAGSVILILLWVYYSSQIVLFGAELTVVRAGVREAVRAPEPAEREEGELPGTENTRELATDLARGALGLAGLIIFRYAVKKLFKKRR